MNRFFDQYLTYRQWLIDRGQPASKVQSCKFCGYHRQAMPAQILVYDSLTDQEKGLLVSLTSTKVVGFYPMAIYPCSTNDGRVCVDQWQDWQQVQLIIFLGNPSATLVIGEQRFAQQQGRVGKLTDNTSYCLTFHPRDILRYRDNEDLWYRDLQTVVTHETN